MSSLSEKDTTVAKRAVDPAVVSAIQRASPPRPAYLLPFLRLLMFHLYFFPTSLIAIPLFLLRSLIPALRLNRNWSLVSSTYIMVVRRVMRNLIRFHVQPIAARKGGLRDQNSIIAAIVSAANLSGPGGSVIHAKEKVKALKLDAQTGRIDKVWVPPAGPEHLDGILAVKTSANDRRKIVTDEYTGPPLLDAKWAKWHVRAFWFTHKPHTIPPQPRATTKPDRAVLLYFHGGAGVTFNAGDLQMGQNLAKNLARNAGIDVFSLDYNLAPFAPSPVQLYQALSGYLYLLNEMKYAPEQIYIGGDSHGGWLTLQLERYLRSYKQIVYANPSSARIPGLVLLSPWVAPDNLDFKSREGNVGQDIIDLKYEEWGIRAAGYRSLPFPLADPWITHINKSMSELAAMPPAFVANGGVEVLLDEGQHFVNQLRRANNLPTSTSAHRIILSPGELNCKVVHHVYPYMVHDYFTVDTEVGKACQTYKQINTWLKFTNTLL